MSKNKSAKCWEWTGSRTPKGYGQSHGNTLAHRVAYESYHGAIPRGFVVHHVCENRLCVNPSHLVAMSKRDHDQLHAQTKLKHFCRNCGEKKYSYKVKSGVRAGRTVTKCRSCFNEQQRKRHHKYKDRINARHRDHYEKNKARINERQRANYARKRTELVLVKAG